MKNNFKSICEAVCHWLGYQYSIGRERLIHEASLRYPISDAITSSEVSIDKIQLERGHPYFEDKRVDIFVCNKKVEKINVESIDSVFELKISKQSTGAKFSKEHQRIVDDVLRLAYFNLMSNKDAYFLICGRYKDFKNYFIGDMDEQPTDDSQDIIIKEQQGKTATQKVTEVSLKTWRTENSLYKDYFDFMYIDPEKTSDPIISKEYTFEKQTENPDDDASTKKEKKFGLRSFQENYIPKQSLKFEERLKIKTICMAITPFESISNRTHACGIWKIEAKIES